MVLESIPAPTKPVQCSGKAAFGLNEIALQSIRAILECQILGAVGPTLVESAFIPAVFCDIWHKTRED